MSVSPRGRRSYVPRRVHCHHVKSVKVGDGKAERQATTNMYTVITFIIFLHFCNTFLFFELEIEKVTTLQTFVGN